MSEETQSPYKEFRKDGWPLCPRCEEDELYSHVMIAFFGTGEPPSVEECIAGGMCCYRCGWDSAAAAQPVEEKSRRLLVVLYKLAEGRTDVQVSQVEWLREAATLGVLKMSREEFDEFHRRTLEEVELKRRQMNEWPEVIGG